MNSKLEEIRACLYKEMHIFKNYLKKNLDSEIALVNEITDYFLKSSGKQIRPTLILLIAGACGGITPLTYRGASLVELLHNATLVHDDIVDESAFRRGRASINHIWQNKSAVWYGNYLFSKSLLLALKEQDYDLLAFIQYTIDEMSRGELIQTARANKLDITEKTYFQIIEQKTATLFKTCCQIGAYSAQASLGTIKKMGELGLKLGVIFQLQDDLIDYHDSEITGKTQANDIKQRKITLSLIHSLNKATKAEKKHIFKLLKSKTIKDVQVNEIIAFVQQKNGNIYVQKIIQKFLNETKLLINQLSPSVYRKNLHNLANFIVERKA